MTIKMTHREIDKAIRSAINNDSLSEDSFLIVDNDIITTRTYLDVMQEISNISQRMNWVKDYDKYIARKFEYPFAFLATPMAKNMKVLDAGCSIDPFAPFLSSKGQMVFGVDNFSSHDVSWDPDNGLFEGRYTGWRKVQVYTEHLRNTLNISVNYYNDDMASTKFSDKYFDRIFCISVLEHLPKYKVKIVFDEWRRILARDGLMILTLDYVTQGVQQFNIGETLEEVGFILQSKVSIFGTHNLHLGNTQSEFPHIVAAFVVKPHPNHHTRQFSKIYRRNRVVKFTIDQAYKRATQVAKRL